MNRRRDGCCLLPPFSLPLSLTLFLCISLSLAALSAYRQCKQSGSNQVARAFELHYFSLAHLSAPRSEGTREGRERGVGGERGGGMRKGFRVYIARYSHTIHMHIEHIVYAALTCSALEGKFIALVFLGTRIGFSSPSRRLCRDLSSNLFLAASYVVVVVLLAAVDVDVDVAAVSGKTKRSVSGLSGVSQMATKNLGSGPTATATSARLRACVCICSCVS